MKTVRIFNINIANIDFNKLLKSALGKIRKNERCFIITLNSLMIIRYLFNKSFREAVNNADIIVPDGYGVVFAGKVLRKEKLQQLPGVEIMYKLFGMAYEKEMSVFLLGGSWRVVETAYKNLVKWFPRIKFLGRYSGYFNKEEESRIMKGINKMRPDMIFIAMGSPKQELWIYDHFKDLKTKVIIGVGGSLDIAAGFKRRAPEKWRKKNLEWLYRSITTPSKFVNVFKILFFIFIVFFFKIFKRNN